MEPCLERWWTEPDLEQRDSVIIGSGSCKRVAYVKDLLRLKSCISRWHRRLGIGTRRYRDEQSRNKRSLCRRNNDVGALKKWLSVWQTKALRRLQVPKWSNVLQMTRNWRRYLYTLSFMRAWVEKYRSGALVDSKRRATELRDILGWRRNKVRSINFRFFALYLKTRRAMRKRAFLFLRLTMHMRHIYKNTWSRLKLADGLLRWRRRARW